MSLENHEVNLEDMLPPWAKALAHGELVVGAQLPTRDGRRMGNAHIVDIGNTNTPNGKRVHLVLTDAGNTMLMFADEIQEAFYPPKYVSDVDEIINKFWREDTPLIRR